MSEFDAQSRPTTVTEIRRVRRSRQDRVIGGVCGGLGRYLQVDPVLLRIAAVALALSGGLGVLAYIIAWIAIPEETGDEPVLVHNTNPGERTFITYHLGHWNQNSGAKCLITDTRGQIKARGLGLTVCQ